MKTNRMTARMAGLWYLLLGICSAFSMMYVDAKLYVPGDAAATASNILASEWLFRFGFVINLVGQAAFLFLACALYKLFRPVDRDQARLMVVLIVASIPIACLDMLNQYAPILLLGNAQYLSAFEPAQLQALAMMFLEMHKQGYFIAEIFWGLWLFPLGVLVFKSGSGGFSKVLGVLLMMGCFGYLIESLVVFLAPDYRDIASPGITIAAAAEISCIVWLLVKGVPDQKPAPVD